MSKVLVNAKMVNMDNAPLTASPTPIRIRQLLIGQARPFGPNGEPSAIHKQQVHTGLRLTHEGLEGDMQADRRHHGGPEKALHHYPAEHYAFWQTYWPELPQALWSAGAFGENLSTTGLTETQVCVGDIFALGTARLQISQARQPCWKLNVCFGHPDMARQVQEQGRTGWYYRVLATGQIAPDTPLILLERPHPQWTLARLLHALYQTPLEQAVLEEISQLHSLSPSWRQLARKRLESGRVEAWELRLHTPAIQTGAPAQHTRAAPPH